MSSTLHSYAEKIVKSLKLMFYFLHMKENKPFYCKGKLRSLVPNTMRYKENIEMGLLLNFHKNLAIQTIPYCFAEKRLLFLIFSHPSLLTCHIKEIQCVPR